MVYFGEGAALSDALVVLRGIAADDLVLVHFDSEMLFHKIDSTEDREEGIPLAASRPADFSDLCKRSGCHLVGQRKRLVAQRCGLGENGNKHA